jgi:hypothetical protein
MVRIAGVLKKTMKEGITDVNLPKTLSMRHGKG